MDIFDIVGTKFGRLVVIKPLAVDRNRNRPYEVRCDCGTIKSVVRGHLLSGDTRSCGCINRETPPPLKHGEARNGKKSAEWRTWWNMIARCEYPSHNRFKHYGGRGIKVCKKWRSSYDAFLSDMGRRPSPVHSIDRINVDKNYTPSNCRWATRHQQAVNKQKRRV